MWFYWVGLCCKPQPYERSVWSESYIILYMWFSSLMFKYFQGWFPLWKYNNNWYIDQNYKYKIRNMFTNSIRHFFFTITTYESVVFFIYDNKGPHINVFSCYSLVPSSWSIDPSLHADVLLYHYLYVSVLQLKRCRGVI